MTTINLITQFLNATNATIAVNVPLNVTNVPVNVTNVTNDMLAKRVYFNADELVHGVKDEMVINWESGSVVVGNCDKGHVFVIHHDRMLWDTEHVLERMSMYQAICMVARQMQEYDYTLWRDHHCVIEVDGEAFLTCC
ncbi:MAG: hypothetical protein E6Q68_06780 [Polynucleobacter sp.]|nr:MAG: hypothetical protein E6Q68_06780 [Polynucleobacter sp.]